MRARERARNDRRIMKELKSIRGVSLEGLPKTKGLQSYLRAIDGLELPEPFSETTKRFIDFVVDAHSWYKIPLRKNDNGEERNIFAFNFYIGPGPLVEDPGALHERVHDDFQYLKYGTPLVQGFNILGKIPREIYDAGLAIVEGNYQGARAKIVMECSIGNMIEAIKEYQQRHPSLRTRTRQS